MSELIQYLVKLTISLAVVWLFYQFILRRLTFYNSNRLYLLAYTLLSFFIPFVNISSLFEGRSNEIIQFVPSVHQYTSALENASNCPAPIWSNYDKWDFIAFGLLTVAGLLFLRLLISYFSFLKIQQKATLISEEGIKIYQVDENIIPFSFGNSIFINSKLHTEAELEEIVRHEFVHVRQNHTIDIVWAELLCILNWYNPFAWLLKRSIRQNLEFIADNKVIENGINKKEYQYLLLKVIGNSQFSIATQFNFSSLKKRIVMMNKTKSTKRQLGRFLFLVPVLAIILLSFRHSFKQGSIETTTTKSLLTDTIPDVKILNSKGYYIDIKDNKGECMVVIKDKEKKEVKRVLLTEWNAKADYYESLYGEILAPKSEAAFERLKAVKESIIAKNPDITGFEVKGNIATVTLKNGKTETYTLSIKDEKKAFEERCGLKEVEIASTIVAEPSEVETVIEVAEIPVKVSNAELAEVTVVGTPSKKIVTTNGEIKEVTVVGKPLTKTIAVNPELEEVVVVGSPSKKAITSTNNTEAVTVVGKPGNVSTTVKSNVVSEAKVATTAITDVDPATIGDLDISITIKNTTKPEDLESFISKLKEKGYELKFTNKNYNDGILNQLSGTIKYKDSSSTFSFTDFDQAVIKTYRDGDKVYFKVYTGKLKVTT